MRRLMVSLVCIGVVCGGWTVFAQAGDEKPSRHLAAKADLELGDRLLATVGKLSSADASPLVVAGCNTTPLLVGSAVPRPVALAQLVPTVALVASTDTPGEPGGWLGIIMSTLPEPLAGHLGLEDQGIMVLNVARSSPAEEAGLKQYDVIVELGGEKLSGDFGEFAEQVRSHRPGDRVKLQIIHDGEPLTVEVVLGEHPGHKSEVDYLYEVQPQNVVKQELKGLSQIIRRDDEGNWVIEDLGELEDFDLSPFILGQPDMKQFNWFFKSLDRTLKAEIGDDHGPVTISITDDDDHTITVTHSGGADDPIVVTRIRVEDGDKVIEEESYQDEDELAAEDPEAYELFKSVRGQDTGFRFHFLSPDVEDLTKQKKEWALQIGRSIAENEEVWRDVVEETMEAAHEAQEEAMEAAREAQAEAKEAAREAREEAMGHYGQALKMYEDALKQAPLLKDWKGKWGAPHGHFGAPSTSITVQADGEIHVTTKRGGTTLKRIFRNEDELREQDERLYHKYQKVLEAEEETQD